MQGSPIKGRKITNVLINSKGKKKTQSQIDFTLFTKELEQSILNNTTQYDNLKLQVTQCASDNKIKKKRKTSAERQAAIKKSQQLFSKKKKPKPVKSVDRVKSLTDCKTNHEVSYMSPDFIKRKKAATFFNNAVPNTVSLQQHRREMGLEFLNNITTKKLDQILERNRMSSIEKSVVLTPEKRRSIFTPNQLEDLKHYIKEKRRFTAQIEQIKQQSRVVRLTHINDNLRNVAENAKRSSLSNSRSPPKDSAKKSQKPLMLSYVQKKSVKKKSKPQSLKVQYESVAQRFKSLKKETKSFTERHQIPSNSSSYSIRSRDYEIIRAVELIQKNWRGALVRQRMQKYKLEQHERRILEEEIKMKVQKEFDDRLDQLRQGEAKKWELLRKFLLETHVKEISHQEINEQLVHFAEYNRDNIFKEPIELNIRQDVSMVRDIVPPQLSQILFLRSELIKEREQKEKDILKQLLIQDRISPRSFGRREEEIVSWGKNEQNSLQESKTLITQGWIKAYETIQKTQKDLRFLKKMGSDRRMPLSLSQSNLLKSQLNQVNLLRSYSDENLLFQSEVVESIGTNLQSYIQNIEGNLDSVLRMLLSIWILRFRTHLAYIRNYLDEIKSIVCETFVNSFREKINIPIGPSAFEILKFFRMTEEMLDQSMDGGFIHQAVLSLDIFTQRERLTNIQSEFLIELDRIHNKAIFDAFNEALDYYRPFGIKGRPLPWKKQVKQRKIVQCESVLQAASNRVAQWAEMLCGIFLPSQGYDAEILPQIRDERLLKMLHQEVYETDDRWQEFDEELTEVSLELSDTVFEQLLNELLGELSQPKALPSLRVKI